MKTIVITQEERDRYEAQRPFREAKLKELTELFRRIICDLEPPEDVRRDR